VLLLVAAGRALGPTGLGAVALGYAALLIPTALHRALIVDPYVTRADEAGDASAYAAAVSLTLLGALGVGVVFFVAGSAFESSLAQGLLVFSLWIPAYLVQALYRPAAFRKGHGGRAAGCSAVMLLTLMTLLLAGRPGTLASVTAAWGLGMSASAVLALARSGPPRLATPRRAFRWFVDDAFPFGRWLAIASGVYSVCSYLTLAIMASVLGPAAVGAYRAVESVFAPLSLLGPGLSNPGYRELRLARESRREISVAALISGLAVALTAAYAGVLYLLRDLFTTVFGDEFTEYLDLVPPIAVAQLILAAPLGFALLVKVARRGDLYLPVGLLTPLASVVAVGIVAPQHGLLASAWAIALCGVLSAGWAVVAALYVSRAPASVAGEPERSAR
jgi:O-antigen/teichoic acid export membrane protein